MASMHVVGRIHRIAGACQNWDGNIVLPSHFASGVRFLSLRGHFRLDALDVLLRQLHDADRSGQVRELKARRAFPLVFFLVEVPTLEVDPILFTGGVLSG